MTKCCTVKIKDLDRVIVIERFTHALNASGFDDTTFATYATVYAKIEPLNSRERFQAQQLAFKTTHKMTIRYSALNIAITTTDRVKLGSRFFNIQGIININEDNKFIQLNVQESLEAST